VGVRNTHQILRCLTGKSRHRLVQSKTWKYSPFVLAQISSSIRPSHPTRGAARDRHERAVGCGGREGHDWRAWL